MYNNENLILLLPVVVSAFWFVTISLSAYENNWRKFALSFFMLSVAISIFIAFLFFIGDYVLYEKLYIVGVFFSLSQFPSFYNFVVSLTSEKPRSYTFYLKHWITPFALTIVAFFVQFKLLSGTERLYFIDEVLTGNVVAVGKFEYAFNIDKILKLVVVLSAFFYFHLINKRVNNHEEQILDYFSNTEEISFKWFNIFKTSFFAAFISGVFYYSLDRSFHIHNVWLSIIAFSLLATFYWIVGYLGNKQIDIYKVSSKEKSNIDNALLEISDEEIVMDSNKAKEIASSVDAVIKNKKLFLNKNLTLVDLVLITRVDRNSLLHVIKTQYNLNFSEYINHKRINHAKEILSSYEIVSTERLYKKCGFKSYIRFNDVFKEFAGETPTAYRNKILLSEKIY